MKLMTSAVKSPVDCVPKCLWFLNLDCSVSILQSKDVTYIGKSDGIGNFKAD